MPSLTVLIPTLNCMGLLPKHVASMRPWLHLAQEIIVVDSHSTDGTLEYLHQELAGYPVNFHSRPRGLYQSWNYGIQQATQPWLYISTVGDSIDAELLQHLLVLGEAAKADVVLSRPHYLFDPGHEGKLIRWAIHDIVGIAAPQQDFLLSGTGAQFFAVLHAHTSALLGSSASNLYRTAVFQENPLPVEYGTAGDSAWGLRHALRTRVACTAREGSTFRIHAKSYAAEDYHVDQLHDRLQYLGLETCRQAPQPDQLTPLNIPEILALSEESAIQYADIKRRRKPCTLWFLHPGIWSARRASKRTLQFLERRRAEAYAQIREKHITHIDLGKPTTHV